MIKVNLSTLKKPIDLANVGGMDLSKLNVKMVVIAIVLFYVPDLFIVDGLRESKEARERELDELNQRKLKLEKEVSELKNFDKQIEQLKRREDELAAKLEVVKSIINTKKNPWNILVYVAKNIPPEIWLTEIKYEGNKLSFKGLSTDYLNQGVFLENLKKSIFFDKNISYSKIEAPATSQVGYKLAPFEVSTTISRFD